MKIRDLDLERYVIVYDIGKSECSDGMTIVGKVIELEFDDYDKNKALIESMQNEYEITDDNEFEFWTKSIEDKTEHIGDDRNKSVRWIDDNTLQTNLGHKINISEDMLKDTEFNLDGYVKGIINEMNKKDKRVFKVGLGASKPTFKYNQSNDIQQRKRNEQNMKADYYQFDDFEMYEIVEAICKHYNPVVAAWIGQASYSIYR